MNLLTMNSVGTECLTQFDALANNLRDRNQNKASIKNTCLYAGVASPQ